MFLMEIRNKLFGILSSQFRSQVENESIKCHSNMNSNYNIDCGARSHISDSCNSDWERGPEQKYFTQRYQEQQHIIKYPQVTDDDVKKWINDSTILMRQYLEIKWDTMKRLARICGVLPMNNSTCSDGCLNKEDLEEIQSPLYVSDSTVLDIPTISCSCSESHRRNLIPDCKDTICPHCEEARHAMTYLIEATPRFFGEVTPQLFEHIWDRFVFPLLTKPKRLPMFYLILIAFIGVFIANGISLY